MVLWLKYEPQELVDTSNQSNEEWLSYRRRGIGGSDAAAILGISLWRTARDLYYDKLSVVKADMDENWVALEMGHLLEDLVARIFAKKTGLRIFQRKVMFQHPLYTADMDVSEITQRMTVDEAKTVVVQIGTCRGWTLEQVAQRRPASLKWYLYGCDHADNILKAAASVLLDNLQQKAG